MLSRNRTTPNHLDLNNKDNPNNKKKKDCGKHMTDAKQNIYVW